MRNRYTLIIFLLPLFLLAQAPKDDFKNLDNVSIKATVYSLKYISDDGGFKIKVINGSKSGETNDFVWDVNAQILAMAIVQTVNTTFTDTLKFTDLEESERNHLLGLKEIVLARKRSAMTDAQRTFSDVDQGKNQYSGRLIINKKVAYQVKEHKDSSFKKAADSLMIIDAKVEFFNNKATSIYIKAMRPKYDSKKKDSVVANEKLIFLNNKFSVAVRYFNYYGSKVPAQSETGEWLQIDYNDVFDYESDQYYNYSVANSQISLSTVSPDSISKKVLQRRFFDYFTAIIYSDVLSFNTENSNSLLNAQAKLLLPLNLRNPGIWSFARQLSASANVALSNSFSDENRFIAISDDETFDHFDLIKKQNIYGKLDFQAINLEYKRLFMNISLGYSAAFYRTGFRYTETIANSTDSITNRQLLSLSHGPFLNFEIRPQSNFGADLVVSLEDFNYSDTGSINGREFKNDIIDNADHNHLGIKYNIINVEANFYWLTSKEKAGGVYAKLGTYYHTQSKSIFPQLMVGYATNLTSFVNRFKSQSETKE